MNMNGFYFGRKMLRRIIIIAVIALAGLSYAKNPDQKTELLVSAAASLNEVMTALGTRFEQQNPQIKVVYNFAATGVLQTQIEQGAPVDVFAGASQKNLEDLSGKGLLVQQSAATLCHNTLVLVIRSGLTIPGSTGFPLMESPVIQRIAIGNPSYVPAGKYAMELLGHLKITNAIRSKLIYASNVREALSWVETGETDAALIYATDAKIAKRIRIVTQTSPEGPVKISYGIALIRQGAAKSDAWRFLDYVTGSTGRKLFEQYGFLQ